MQLVGVEAPRRSRRRRARLAGRRGSDRAAGSDLADVGPHARGDRCRRRRHVAGRPTRPRPGRGTAMQSPTSSFSSGNQPSRRGTGGWRWPSMVRPDASAQLVDGLDAAREDLDESRRDQAVALVERPDRHVAARRRRAARPGSPRWPVSARAIRVSAVRQPDSRRSAASAACRRALEAAGELDEGDDRALELAGQDLEAAADLGHLDLTVLGVAAAGHELEVVDDDEAQVAEAGLEAAGLGPDLHDREVRVVVDPQRRFAGGRWPGRSSPSRTRSGGRCASSWSRPWPRCTGCAG